jgi:hypothetical protein
MPREEPRQVTFPEPQIPPLHRAPPPIVGDPILDSLTVRQHCGNISEATLSRYRKADFPPPDVQVYRRNFWRLSTIERWLASKKRLV